MSPRESGGLPPLEEFQSPPSMEAKDHRNYWERVSDGVAKELHTTPEEEQIGKYIEAKAQLLALQESYQKQHGSSDWQRGKALIDIDTSDLQGADYRVTAMEQLLINRKDELASGEVQQAIERRKAEILGEKE